jgi:RNA polymerase sigma-70 factor (ECF subfamily)
MSIGTIPHSSDKALTQEFEQIFREHCQFVYRTAYSVTGNHADAEDVLQAIFLKLIQMQMTERFWNEPKAYLYRSTVNLALNTMRSRKRQNLTHDIESLEAPALSDSTDKESLQRDLMKAIAQLPPSMVEMVILRYGHDYSDAQIAKMLGKSRGTVAVTLYRARARLKKFLRDGENA